MESDKYILGVEGVSKKFRLNASEKQRSFIEALNDMSFLVKAGEGVGLIGANGSGKSTLLKIISGIIKPDRGLIKHYGKYLSILDLGFGMIPDFTGIENIFLLGSLEGYSKVHMNSLLDRIIDFADLGDFIYEPVKEYSNGMFLRLAFSIRMVLHADLLILDEVIGVGDAMFQEKSRRAIGQMIENGCAIIVAGHSPQALLQMCSRLIWIDKGRIKSDGPANMIMNEYLLLNYEKTQINELSQTTDVSKIGAAQSHAPILLNQITVNARNKKQHEPIYLEDEIEISINYTKQNPSQKSEVALHVFTLLDVHVLVDCLTFRQQVFDYIMTDGKYTATCIIPARFLNIGTYYVSLTFIQDTLNNTIDFKKQAVFTIELNKVAIPAGWLEDIGAKMLLNDAILKPHLKWTLKNKLGEIVFNY